MFEIVDFRQIVGFDYLGRPILQTQIPTGRSYVIEYPDDLQGPWSPLDEGKANGKVLDVQDPAAPGGHRFYRLRVP